MPTLPRQILTVKEVADVLRCDIGTVYRLIKRKAIPCFRVGADYRFERGELAQWMQRGGGR